MRPREAVLAQIASEIIALPKKPITLIAVDGVDGAGKTRFADELVACLPDPVIRASVDSFHNPRSVRYKQGPRSPMGYFEDSFNYDKLLELLLDPLTTLPPKPYCCAYFDYRTDFIVPLAWEDPPERGTLIFDGIFAHRPQLLRYWDYSLFLEVSPKTSVQRCIDRDGLTGVSYDPDDPIHARYVQGQAIYLKSCDPLGHCTRSINNEDINTPKISS